LSNPFGTSSGRWELFHNFDVTHMSFFSRFFVLNTGAKIPALGIGTWQAPPGEVERAVAAALQAGYRHVDAAAIYQNEKEVGEGIRLSGVPRKDIWVTSKLWNNSHRPEEVPKGLDKTLSDLGLEYLDLYLMHWPSAFKPGQGLFPKEADGTLAAEEVDFVETWKAMEKLTETGKVKNIGVSNFSRREMERLLQNAKIRPAVIQFEGHPHLAQTDYIKWLNSEGIHVTAYSSFGDLNPFYRKEGEPSLIEEATIKKIAEKHGKTPFQVLLSWGISRGTSVIPKSSNPTRVKENSELFELSQEEIDEINKLDKGKRYNNPSERFKYKLFQ